MDNKMERSRYQLQEKLGEGTYGKVYKAYDTRRHGYVAIKQMKLDGEDIHQSTLREISALKKLQSPYIVKLLDVEFNPNWTSLIFPLYETDLQARCRPLQARLDFQRVREYMRQLLAAVAEFHEADVLHRDIKPHNIFLRGDNLVLGDLGLSRLHFANKNLKYTKEIQTLYYRAPEVLLGNYHYSSAIDIWSVGCVFAYMLKREHLFKGDSAIDQLFKIFKIMGTPTQQETKYMHPESTHDMQQMFPQFAAKGLAQVIPEIAQKTEGLDLLDKMLRLNPKDRITAKEALQHEFFAKTSDISTKGNLVLGTKGVNY